MLVGEIWISEITIAGDNIDQAEHQHSNDQKGLHDSDDVVANTMVA
jgi:hypothetical protein